MTEEKLWEILDGIRSGIDLCLSRLDHLEGRMNELDRIFYDDILNPAKEAIDRQMRNEAVEDFRGAHAEKFEPYIEPLKAIEGEDFDVVETTFEQYEALPEPKPDVEEFVSDMVEQIVGQIEDVKAKLGITGDVTATVTEEGEVEVKTEDGEVVAETNEEGEIEVKEEIAEEGGEPAEGDVDEEVAIDEETGEVVDDPAEVEAFEEELLKMVK